MLPAAEPEPAPAGPQSLQAALQQILAQAAEGGADLQAIGAFAAAAEAMAEEMEGDDEGLGDSSDEEAAAEAVAGGGVPALLQQLQQQAAAAAEEAALPPPVLPPGAVLGGEAAAGGAAAPPAEQHSRRVWVAAAATEEGSAGLLWSLLGAGLAQFEVARRDPAGGPCRLAFLLGGLHCCRLLGRGATAANDLPCPARYAGAPSAEVSAAHWRALQSLAQLAAAAGSGGGCTATSALDLAQGLADGSLQQLPAAASLLPDASAALLPSLQQLQLGPSPGDYTSSQVGAVGSWLGLLAQ